MDEDTTNADEPEADGAALGHLPQPGDPDSLEVSEQEVMFRGSGVATRMGDARGTRGGDAAGRAAFDAFRGLRIAVGRDPDEPNRFVACEHGPAGCLECMMEQQLGANLIPQPRSARDELRYETAENARRVAAAFEQPPPRDGVIVALPEALDSLVVADGFELTFRDGTGVLFGWVEPDDDHPTLWDVHLFPGVAYPPDTEPREHRPASAPARWVRAALACARRGTR